MADKRILVVEDEYLIATEIESVLRDGGIEDVVSAATEEAALKEVRYGRWDAVVADANLNGVGIDRIAAALLIRGIPLLIVTGYNPESLPAQVSEVPRIGKPFTGPELIVKLTQIMA
jgi:CheY-like chemotaxis protein